MNEKIYTIPVNDAFDSECECPVCSMYKALEDDAVQYTMGPSYMEDDIRAVTDRMGFCQKHIKKIYDVNNRLGFALVIKTHMDKVIKDVESYENDKGSGKKLMKKGKESGVCDYLETLRHSCFVCDRIDSTFERYLDTVFHMYKHDKSFKEKYAKSKGFCNEHYRILMKKASEKLGGSEYEEFTTVTSRLYLENLKRVRDDVEWFINKFDHNYSDAPWKNAKDSLPRAITKCNSLLD